MGAILHSLLACIASAGACAVFLLFGVPADGFSSTSWIEWFVGALVVAHLLCLFIALAMASSDNSDFAPMIAAAPAALLWGGAFVLGQAFNLLNFL